MAEHGLANAVAVGEVLVNTGAALPDGSVSGSADVAGEGENEDEGEEAGGAGADEDEDGDADAG